MTKVQTKTKPASKSNKPQAGAKSQYVIVRSDRAGVFAGELASPRGEAVTLNACRRLWDWTAVAGVALSGVAINGLVPNVCKVDTETSGHYITGVLEVIPCSSSAEASIRAYK